MKRVKFIADVKEGRIVPRTNISSFLQALDGTAITVEVSAGLKRTNSQNSYLWGVVYPYVCNGMAAQGNYYGMDDVHEYMKHKFLPRKEVNGEMISGSTTGLNKAEFADYVEKISGWAMEYLGITIPEPHGE